jgi:fatty-acyl-CoA synthase
LAKKPAKKTKPKAKTQAPRAAKAVPPKSKSKAAPARKAALAPKRKAVAAVKAKPAKRVAKAAPVKTAPAASPYLRDLDKNPANYTALTPIHFLERSARTFPETIAVRHGDRAYSYREFYARTRRLASALVRQGIKKYDTVALLAPNIPAMLESHYGVPMTGAVINTINYRLSAAEIAFILDHGEAKVFIVDREFGELAKSALLLCKAKPYVVGIDDGYDGGMLIGSIEYEDFIAKGDPDFAWSPPTDEWDPIALNYTSGTTGNPKGVVYHHRGAYLLAMGNVISASIGRHPVYLWSVPMFHCNGWCFTWSISIVAGTHVCLRRVTAGNMYDAASRHDVTHMCGAPIVMSMLVGATETERKPLKTKIEFMTAAAPPPAATLARMEAAGFQVHHVYGLTETYGPSVVNAWHDDWNAKDLDERARIKARQGVRYVALEGLRVMDPDTMTPVPEDGATMGEVMFRGNVVMKGYLKNPSATQAAFKGGWFHSGDLGVCHPDGYIQLKDRSKDIIISGGENISSIEVEDVLMKHPAVSLVAVVGMPDEKWGETPVAFIEIKPGFEGTTANDIIAFCKQHIGGYKVPRQIYFQDLPKTSTGKIQKFKLRGNAPPIAAE